MTIISVLFITNKVMTIFIYGQNANCTSPVGFVLTISNWYVFYNNVLKCKYFYTSDDIVL